MDPAAWALAELGTAQLGDARRTRRLATLVTTLAARPAASVPVACGSWAATKAAYRFWDCADVTPAAIRAAHQAATRARIPRHATILVLQDTTLLEFTHHPALVGTGPRARPDQTGVLLHSALAADLDGVPLGLLHQQQWARAADAVGQRHRRRQRPTAEKESQRWLDTLVATQADLPPTTHVITVADREADIYDLFAVPRPATSDLLIRATHNRRVDHEARYLWDAVRQPPPAGLLPVALRRHDDRPPREAILTIRCLPRRLLPPRHHPRRTALAPIPVVAILAEEVAPPPGIPAIRWLLVTTRRVLSLEEAVECVRWYQARWLIERYHYGLKQGCRVEELQLQTVERLERAVATYALVAWRLLWLTYQARAQPDQPCTIALAPHEWQALWCTIHHAPIPPPEPPPLWQAGRWIAQLGGFLGRAGDGEPGLRAIWQGLRRLEDIVATWLLLHSLSPPLTPPAQLVGKA